MAILAYLIPLNSTIEARLQIVNIDRRGGHVRKRERWLKRMREEARDNRTRLVRSYVLILLILSVRLKTKRAISSLRS